MEQYEDISVFDDFIQKKKKKKKRESVRVVGVNWIEKRKELKGQKKELNKRKGVLRIIGKSIEREIECLLNEKLKEL